MPTTGRLAFLWLCGLARALGDACLFGLVLSQLAGQGRPSDWTEPVYWLLAPAVLLAPVAGLLSIVLSQGRMLLLATAFTFSAVSLYFFLDGPWLLCWIVVAAALAVYLPAHGALRARFASGWMQRWMVTTTPLFLSAGFAFALTMEGARLFIVACNGVALLAAIPLAFPEDVPRGQFSSLLGDVTFILRDGELRTNLLAQTAFAALTFGVLFTWLLGNLSDRPAAIFWLLGGFAAGCALVGCQTHLRRLLGLATLTATLFTLILLFATPSPVAFLLLGLASGGLHIALLTTYQAPLSLTPFPGGEGKGVRGGTGMVARTASLAAGCLVAYLVILNAGTELKMLLPIVVAIGVTLLLWLLWHREVIEQGIEVLILPLYRIRGHGDGLRHMPRRGPVLIVANHACWFDPIFLAKLMPRRLTPMMVSTFYDLPVLRWLMVYVVGAIRVQKATYRREAPELQEAIAALDRDGCVVIFPEGGLRRKEEAPLRRFGQGAWHILRDRPDTTVVCCWIEGNWGSYFSYFNGPPTKNKRFDFGRSIDIAVTMPERLPPKLLEDQRRTRLYLMEQCLAARTLLGLPAAPPPAFLTENEEESDDAA